MSAATGARQAYEAPSRAAVVVGAGAAALALGSTAAFAPRYAILALLAGAFAVLVVGRLSLGVAIFAVLTFPEHLPGALGIGATLAKPVGALLLLAWAGLLAARPSSTRNLVRDSPPIFWTIVAFLLLAATSVLWAADPAQAQYALSRLVQVALLLVVAYTAASSCNGFRTIVWGFLAGSAVTATYSVASGVHGPNGRLAALFDPNYFAAALIPAIIVAVFLAATPRRRSVRLLAACVVAIDLTAFVLTQSRGGVVGLAAAIVAAVAAAGRARPRLLVVLLALVAVGIGYYTVDPPSHFAGTLSAGFAGASSGRSDEWRIGLRMVGGHPVAGVGLGNFSTNEPSYAVQTLDLSYVRLVVTDRLAAHNSYLEVAAELGLVGLALFLAIVLLPVRLAARALGALGRAEHPLEFHARGLVAGAVGMLVAYVFLSAQYEKQLWLVLALLASVPALAVERERRETRR